MATRKWRLFILGLVLVSSFFLVNIGQAKSAKGIPEQIDELYTMVSNIQKDIGNLKDAISKIGTGEDSSRATATLTIKVYDVKPGMDDGVTVTPPKYIPIPGGKVSVMDSQGKKWSGTVNSEGICSFTLPEGIYSVRLYDTDPAKYFSDDWQIVTVSNEKPKTVDYSYTIW